MSNDTPRPERVTLSAEERARVREYAAFWWQRETGETDEWAGLAAEEREAVIENSYAETVVDWLAAREQALREERDAAREALARVEARADAWGNTPGAYGDHGSCLSAAWREAEREVRAALRGETR